MPVKQKQVTLSASAPKRRKTVVSQLSLEAIPRPVLTCVLFPLLDLPAHFRLARTCYSCFFASGLPLPSSLVHTGATVTTREAIQEKFAANSVQEDRGVTEGVCSGSGLVSQRQPGAWRKHVDLGAAITSKQLRYLCSFASITSLSCLFRKQDGLALRQLPLQSLDVQSSPELTAIGIADLQDLPLQVLKLFSCENLTDEGLARLQRMPLQYLDISNCPLLTDAGLAHLRCLSLKHLFLGDGMDLTDTGLAYLRNMPLEDLCIGGCDKLTDAGLIHLRHLPLKSLDLGGCAQLTTAGLGSLQHLRLRQLGLGLREELTDAGLAHLQDMPLRSLDLNDCCQLTDAGLQQLQNLPLRDLDVSGCSQLTAAALEHLQRLVSQRAFERWGCVLSPFTLTMGPGARLGNI